MRAAISSSGITSRSNSSAASRSIFQLEASVAGDAMASSPRTASTSDFRYGSPPSPIAALDFIPGWIWLAIKVFAVATMFLWVRATFPRFRYDQIMRLGWKIFIPVTLVWLVFVGLWMQTPFNVFKPL